MTHAKAKARHAELADELRRHDQAYYVEAKPTIPDQAYDRLYHELLDLEKEFPDLLTPDSPSQRVGGEPLTEFKPVAHLTPMMSLDNTYSQEEARDFVARVQKLLPGETLEWIVEPKVTASPSICASRRACLPAARRAATAPPATMSPPISKPSAASRPAARHRRQAAGRHGGAWRGVFDQGRVRALEHGTRCGGPGDLCQCAQRSRWLAQAA